jgi:hypothetical protein
MSSTVVKLEKFKLSKIVLPRWNQRKSDLGVVAPATAKGSVNALRMVEYVSTINQAGSHRPGKFLTAVSPDKTRIYFLPVVASDDVDTLDIDYRKYGFLINLHKLFATHDRLVPPGVREIYTWHMTEESIDIEGTVGRALYIELTTPVKLLVKTRKASKEKQS